MSRRSSAASNISLLSLGATSNGSKGAGIDHLGFWLDDRLRYNGALLFSDLNLDFYSLGQVSLNRRWSSTCPALCCSSN